jgi:hypothetical protein
MNWRPFDRLVLAVATVLVIAACESTSPAGSTDWSRVTNADQGGGMGALVAAAKAERELTVIALRPDWANYGQIISTFEARYGIEVTSLNPNGTSEDAVNAFDGTSRAPDVVDVSLAVALASVGKFAPYQVTEWSEIPAGAKEASGAWYDGHGGYMGVGYDSSKVPAITSLEDLLGPAFRSRVALAGDPTTTNEGLNAVIMAAVAKGGSLDDISAGVNFFKQLRLKGNYVPIVGTDATVIRLAWQGCPDMEDLRPVERDHRRLLQPGHQQAGSAPGCRAAVGGVPLLRRGPESLARGRRPARAPGGDDRFWQDRRHRGGRASRGERQPAAPERGPDVEGELVRAVQLVSGRWLTVAGNPARPPFSSPREEAAPTEA